MRGLEKDPEGGTKVLWNVTGAETLQGFEYQVLSRTRQQRKQQLEGSSRYEFQKEGSSILATLFPLFVGAARRHKRKDPTNHGFSIPSCLSVEPEGIGSLFVWFRHFR